MNKYLKGKIDFTLALGTLGSKVLISANLAETLSESARITSMIGTWSLSEFTQGAGDGPIIVGVSHSDYTSAEVEAVIENTGSWDRGNKTQQEVAKRLVRIIGIFNPDAAPSQTVLNDGRPVRTKLNWAMQTGRTLRLWAYNSGSSPLSTGSSLIVTGHANIFQD